ncbi:MAG TPA: type I-C CRISPR-associated protein Cas8c/Csd1 [Dongiaceae bacterium]
MILARLVALYDRLVTSGMVESNGYERRPIAFLLVLHPDGGLVDVVDTRAAEGRERRGRLCNVPMAVKRTVGIAANVLWDNAEYVLGLPRTAGSSQADQRKVAERHEAFRHNVAELAVALPNDRGVQAVHRVLSTHDPTTFRGSQYAARIDDPTANLSFVLSDDPTHLICESSAVRQVVAEAGSRSGAVQCLVTGHLEAPARLHPYLKGVVGGQPSGVSLVSFNLAAFESYGLEQGANAPVGVSAAFAYGTALNWLLAEPRHRLRLGPLTVVAWAGEDTPAETFLTDVFGEAPRTETEDDRSARVARVRALLDSPRSGVTPAELDTDFFVLGLAPNAARAAVALWEQGRLADALANVRCWFADLELAGRPAFLPDMISLASLLRALAPLHEMDRLPPRLPASLLSAALTGSRLPEELLANALARLRIPRGPAFAYPLTALLRAVLRRNHAMESSVSLDPSATDFPYRWGRLFAVYEKVQEDAQGDIDATVRDSYWASAAATPAVVCGVLSRLNGHHLRKLETPRRIRAERLIGEVVAEMRDFPPRLSLPEQARFALGYWHQRTALFTRREPAEAIPSEAA